MKRFTIIAQDENLEIILVKRAHTLDALLSAINLEENPFGPIKVLYSWITTMKL